MDKNNCLELNALGMNYLFRGKVLAVQQSTLTVAIVSTAFLGKHATTYDGKD